MTQQDRIRLINLQAYLMNIEQQTPRPFEISMNTNETFFNLNPKMQAKGMYYPV